MHVLCVAGINDRYGVALYGIGVVPFVGIRHVVAAIIVVVYTLRVQRYVLFPTNAAFHMN